MRRLPFLAACAAAIAIAGCGGGDDGSSSSSGTPAQSESDNPTEQLFAGSATANLKDPAQGKKGGTLTVLSAGDVDFLDPGKTYYTYTIGIINALHRGLYAYDPQDVEQAGAGPRRRPCREISEDGRTVTVKLRQGLMFSAARQPRGHVGRREVRDRARVHRRGLERLRPDLLRRPVGAPEAPGDYRPVNGIQTPDDTTIVFKLNEGTGAALAGALAMPISVPVPKEFAQPLRPRGAVDLRRAARRLHRALHGRERRRTAS